jgi:prevent-host-death family protein
MAETVTARAANQHLSRLLREVAEGKSFVITHRGRSVARLVPEPAPDAKRLTPQQEQALAESIAWARSLKPPAEPPADLLADWPRNRDELYDEMLRERSGGQ